MNRVLGLGPVFTPKQDARDRDHSGVRADRLVITGGQRTELLEAVETLLD